MLLLTKVTNSSISINLTKNKTGSNSIIHRFREEFSPQLNMEELLQDVYASVYYYIWTNFTRNCSACTLFSFFLFIFFFFLISFLDQTEWKILNYVYIFSSFFFLFFFPFVFIFFSLFSYAFWKLVRRKLSRKENRRIGEVEIKINSVMQTELSLYFPFIPGTIKLYYKYK